MIDAEADDLAVRGQIDVESVGDFTGFRPRFGTALDGEAVGIGVVVRLHHGPVSLRVGVNGGRGWD
jgi:hypothetical protein